jgi:hypothetical protein
VFRPRSAAYALGGCLLAAIIAAFLCPADLRASSGTSRPSQSTKPSQSAEPSRAPEPPPAKPPAAAWDEQGEQLASAKHFYLVLDPETRVLRLMLKGAYLDEYKIESVRVGIPRVLFMPKEEKIGWDFRIWKDGQLDPPRHQVRIEVVPPKSELELDSLQPALPVPPPPEEAYHVPPIYRIRFPEGLDIIVESPPDSTAQGVPTRSEIFRTRLRERWRELRTSLAGEETLVRFNMSAEEAHRLYRALPPDTRFLVAPGFSRAEEPKPQKKR